MTESVIMEFLRTVTSRGHRYRQRVEWYRDPTTRRHRLRIVENLGPERPVYRRPVPPHVSVPMLPVHFGVLATRMMTGTLTAAQVVETVREMGEEISSERLAAVGVRFDLGEKTLALLLWPAPPSSRLRRARSAPPPGRSSVPTRRPPSRSTDRGD